MGLDLVHVLSADRHHCEFECSSCKRLTSLDSFVTKTCSHPICKSCCVRKEGTPVTCPSCSEPVGELVDLCTTQPLAFRVLQRVKVACPVRKRHNCDWSGDYKNLQLHVESHRRSQTRKESAMKKEIPMRSDSTEHVRNPTPVRTPSERSLSSNLNTDNIDAMGNSFGKLNFHVSSSSLFDNIVVDEVSTPREQRRWSMGFNATKANGSAVTRVVAQRRNSANATINTGVSDGKTAMATLSDSVSPGIMQPTSEGTLIGGSRRPSLIKSLSNRIHKTGIEGEKTILDSPSVSKPSLLRNLSNRLRSNSISDKNKMSQIQDSLVSSTHSTIQIAPVERHDEQPLVSELRPKGTDTKAKVNDRSLARSKKERASREFKAGNFKQAVVLYTQALEFMPQVTKDPKFVSSVYSNRGAAHLRLNQYSECLNDTDEALRLDFNNMKAYLRKSWALTEIGRFSDACTTLGIGLGRIPNSSELSRECKYANQLAQTMKDVVKSMDEERYEDVLSLTDSLEPYKSNKFVLLARGEAFLALSYTDKAIEETNAVFLRDGESIEALEIRAKARYLNGRIEDALMDCQTALGIDPNRQSVDVTYHKIRKVEQFLGEAERSMHNNSFRQAVSLYGLAIHASEPLAKDTELYRILYLARANAHLKASNFVQALANANMVLDSSATYVKAWETKIEALEAMNRFEQLVEELREVIKPNKWGSQHELIVEAYENANTRLKKNGPGKKVDYYELLGVAKNASAEEIRRMYKLKAKEWHPDRLVNCVEGEKIVAEEMFKRLQDAVNVLSDANLRRQYDDEAKDP